MEKEKKILLFIWQLPQNLVGRFMAAIYPNDRAIATDNGVKVIFSRKMRGGISLGDRVIVPKYLYSNKLSTKTVKHELGHCKQSVILGWLYLPIVGLQSICWAGLTYIKPFSDMCYYSFWTEKWADKLGGVKRM